MLSPTPYEPFPNVESRNVLQESVEVPALVRSLKLPLGARILEVGCGRGVALPPFAELCRPRRLVGLDVDADLLAVAEQRLRDRGVHAELVHGDVRDLPFADDSFDVVVDFGTCYHVAEPQRALNEIARVLVHRGRFVHETPLSQALAHPIRSRGRLPWREAPRLTRDRTAVLWAARRAL
jgi:ubiquinone/menaquinone biosynthesis C-methylase UbiE